MKKLLLMMLLSTSCLFGWGGDGNSLDGMNTGRGLATAPAPVQWIPGDWDRSNLTTELLFEHVLPNGSSVNKWLNTSDAGSAHDYVQTTAINQPLLASGTRGIWIGPAHSLGATALEDSSAGITRYMVGRVANTGSYKDWMLNYGAGNAEWGLANGTSVYAYGTWSSKVVSGSYPPNAQGTTTIMVMRRNQAFRWQPGAEGARADATQTLSINGTTYQITGVNEGYWNEGGNASESAAISRIIGSSYALYSMDGNAYLYLTYKVVHSDAQVLSTMAAINRYLRRCRIAEATLY